MNKLLEKDDWMIIVILFKFWRECSCTKEYIQKENIKNKKIGAGGGSVKDKGSCFGLFCFALQANCSNKKSNVLSFYS